MRQSGFDPAKGTLSQYHFGIARHHIARARRESKRGASGWDPADGSNFWDTVPGEQRQRAIWQRTWAHPRLRECIDTLRGSEDAIKFEAFRQRVLQRRSAADIAESLSLTTVAVYKATYQIKQKLTSMLQETIGPDDSRTAATPP